MPYAEQTPYTLVPEGRGEDATDHGKVEFLIEPFRGGGAVKGRPLPVAGLPLWKGERFIVSRGKVRPALVLGVPGPQPPKALAAGMARYQVAPAILVAPYFGVDKDGTRAGVPEALLARFRRAEYPQYVWDALPLKSVNESYLRLDQMLAIGSDPASYDLTDYALSEDALTVIDEWVEWLLSGAAAPPDDSTLGYLRTELLKAEAADQAAVETPSLSP